jgi:hypothetical protein
MSEISEALRALTPVGKDQHLLDVVTASRMNAIQTILKALARGEHIVTGPNLFKKSQDGFVTLTALPVGGGGGGASVDMPFIMSLAADASGVTDAIVINVRDGKVNGEFPEGMGEDDFIQVHAPGDDLSDCLVYVEVKFDKETLDITSLDVKTSAAATFPDNVIDDTTGGLLNIPIGFTYVDDDETAHAFNTYIGDINFELVACSLNGAPALLPVAIFGGYMAYPT